MKTTFSITGVINNRLEIKNNLEEFGLTYTSNIDENLDFLLVGDMPGSKLIKAKNFKNVVIVNDIESFLKDVSITFRATQIFNNDEDFHEDFSEGFEINIIKSSGNKGIENLINVINKMNK